MHLHFQLHCALASCGAVYCNRSCLWVCNGRAVSAPYYSHRARSVCVSLSAFFRFTMCSLKLHPIQLHKLNVCSKPQQQSYTCTALSSQHTCTACRRLPTCSGYKREGGERDYRQVTRGAGAGWRILAAPVACLIDVRQWNAVMNTR